MPRSEAVAVLNRCLAEVMGWMRANKLKLNPDKTEVLLLRPYLEEECLATVTHALVTSWLDFCNALYVGLPLKTVRILQMVQNIAARLLMGTGRYSHITQVLYQLHWLPIEVWPQFKVLVITYKALNGLGPGYLKERLLPYLPSRPLRSAAEALLWEPSMKDIRRQSTRRRAFSAVAPHLWNALPREVRLAPSLLFFGTSTDALIVQKVATKTIPKKKKCKKAKWLPEEALQIAEERREAKGKGEGERYTQLNAEFQRTARRDKNAFLKEQCKEVEENNRIGRTRDLFKKIGDMKGTFHAKMGMIKDQNGRDLTEAEEINKRWQDYTEELCKKELNVPDNHDGVVTDLKPDILECEVKWALGSLSNYKASGGDSIPAELFKILKDDAVKVLHSVCQQIWKTQQCPQDWKKSVYILIPKKGNAKKCSNYRTIALISHASKLCSKSYKLGCSSMLTENYQKYRQYFEETEELEIKLPTYAGSWRKLGSSRKTSASASLTMLNPLIVWITTNCGKSLKRWEYQTILCLLRNLYAGEEATVRTGHRTTDWFKTEKGFRQGCILSPCLFNLYAEHIMRKVGLDESPVGIKIAGRNINSLRYANDTTLMAESEEELKSLLMRVKEESEKVGLKLNIKKTKIMASSPLTSWQIDGEEMEVVTDFIFLGSKITTDSDCSQERHLLLWRKVMANLDSILKSRDITLPTKVHIVKAMVFSVAMYGCESWTMRKAEHQRIEAFELWCWRRLLRVPWTARRSNWSVLEEINPDCALEGQIVKMKLKYFGHLMRRKDSLEKSLMQGTTDGKRRRGRQRMRWLDGVTEAVGVSLSGLREMVENRKAWRNVVHGVAMALDPSKDPCLKVKCSPHKVCVTHDYETAICVSRKQLVHSGYFLNIYSVMGTFRKQSAEPGLTIYKMLPAKMCKEIEENNRIGKTSDLFKKIGDMKGTFHAKMGMIKDQNDRVLTEVEEINKRWQDYTEELYKKELNVPDNHDGVVTDLEPDILECEVKWASGSLINNKASGEHIMRKVRLDESPVGIKIAGRNINNLRYADDTTLLTESEEELKSLLMWVKEESTKVGLKLNIKKTKIMTSGPIGPWQIDGEEMEEVADFIFLGSKSTADRDCCQEIKRRLLLWRKAMANLDSILKTETSPCQQKYLLRILFSVIPHTYKPVSRTRPSPTLTCQLSEYVDVLNQCLAVTMDWMRAKKLKLNPFKTEMLLQRRSWLQGPTIAQPSSRYYNYASPLVLACLEIGRIIDSCYFILFPIIITIIVTAHLFDTLSTFRVVSLRQKKENLPQRHWIGPANLVKCKPCPLTHASPVCGSDGHTYTTKCKLEFHACTSGKKITARCEGPCPCLPGQESPKHKTEKNESGKEAEMYLAFWNPRLKITKQRISLWSFVVYVNMRNGEHVVLQMWLDYNCPSALASLADGEA
ncbi:Testican-1 [Varanus komodoensis]|nr:Testican-1 [Varanus komodoensis]